MPEHNPFNNIVKTANDTAGELVDALAEKQRESSANAEQTVLALAHEFVAYDKDLTRTEKEIERIEDQLTALDTTINGLETRAKEVIVLNIDEEDVSDQLDENRKIYEILQQQLAAARERYSEIEKLRDSIKTIVIQNSPNMEKYFTETVLRLEDQEIVPTDN